LAIIAYGAAVDYTRQRAISTGGQIKQVKFEAGSINRWQLKVRLAAPRAG
jgi:hypothetical protein